MNSTVVLFAGKACPEVFEKSFGKYSAFELALAWAESAKDCSQICVIASPSNVKLIEPFASSKVKVVSQDVNTNGELIKTVKACVESSKADYAVFAWGDCPFINLNLTSELEDVFSKYRAEYAFADGYPYGLSPEFIHSGTLSILSELCDGIQKSRANSAVSRDAIFSVMSGDINSFEIETLIAPKDYRMLRFEFECSSKINRLACEKLYELAGEEKDVIAFCDKAEESAAVLKTIPNYYNIQISASYNHVSAYNPYEKFLSRDKSSFKDMDIETYRKIVSKIVETSPDAVICLSAWGEPLLNKDFVNIVKETVKFPGLSLFVETDGLNVTEEIACEVSKIAGDKIDWCIVIDAFEKELYAQIHNCSAEDFEKAVNSVSVLEKYFEHRVYPQLTRMKSNEHQLEQFFKFWRNKESPSKGEVIVQKYDSFAGFLSDEKTADLAPLNRNVCWHLRRDMTVLADGKVPLCRECGFTSITGNILDDSIESVFEKYNEELQAHIKGQYSEMCRKCDEYYTFNF